MIKTVADHLVEIRDTLHKALDGQVDKTSAYFTCQPAVVAIQSAVEMTPDIVEDQAMFMAELENFTGGKTVTATMHRSDEDHQHAFDEAILALARYHDTLRNAKVRGGADHLGLNIDQTDVPDPF